MPIKVTCRCGQQFAAKDELAGKVVKCPKCKEPLKVGETPSKPKGAESGAGTQPGVAAPSAVAALLDEVGFHVHGDKVDETVQHCPACDQKISDHAVLCVCIAVITLKEASLSKARAEPGRDWAPKKRRATKAPRCCC